MTRPARRVKHRKQKHAVLRKLVKHFYEGLFWHWSCGECFEVNWTDIEPENGHHLRCSACDQLAELEGKSL